MQKDQPPARSSLYGVEVVRNKKGWFVNLLVNGSPSQSYGPFDQPMTIAQAFLYLGTIQSLE
jgi:hypothetical protein